MKQILSLFLISFMALSLHAQTAQEVINDFKDARNARYVSLPVSLIGMGSGMMGDVLGDRMKDFQKHVHNVMVLNLDDCSRSVRRKVEKRVKKMARKSYNERAAFDISDRQARLLARGSGDNISELVVFAGNRDAATFVLVKGQFTEEDLRKLINRNE